MVIFQRLMSVFDGFMDFPSICAAVMTSMINNAGDVFENWRNIFYRAKTGSREERLAFREMARCAGTFGNWLCVLSEAIRLGDIHVAEKALAKLTTLAEKPTDATWTRNLTAISLFRWQEIFRLTASCSWLENYSVRQLLFNMHEKKKAAAKKPQDKSSCKI